MGSLSLNQTKIGDLAPLSGLKRLLGLELDRTRVADLAPLAGLSELSWLSIRDTDVSDISPLSGLTELTKLLLGGSRVADLRPLIPLERLITGMEPGLRFRDTPAVHQDAELARLSVIEDPEDRAQQTLDYLKTLPPWPEPLPSAMKVNTSDNQNHISKDQTTVAVAEAQIAALLRHAAVTRLTTEDFADRIDAALEGVPATCGNTLAEPLQTMAEIAEVLRNLAQPETPAAASMDKDFLLLRIGRLEALVERLALQLADEQKAREAAEALASKDGFWSGYRKGAGNAAGVASVGLVTIGAPSIAVYFLGMEHPAVQAVLTVLGRRP